MDKRFDEIAWELCLAMWRKTTRFHEIDTRRNHREHYGRKVGRRQLRGIRWYRCSADQGAVDANLFDARGYIEVADMSQKPNTIEEYDEILRELRELIVAKNADYGDSWRQMRLPSITDQILVKVCRIRSLEESKDAPKVSEGVESEYRDIINYCIFALIKLREAEEP